MMGWEELRILVQKLLDTAYQEGTQGRQITDWVQDCEKYIANNSTPEYVAQVCNNLLAMMIQANERGLNSRLVR